MNVIIEYHLRVAYIQSLLQVDIEINGPYVPGVAQIGRCTRVLIGITLLHPCTLQNFPVKLQNNPGFFFQRMTKNHPARSWFGTGRVVLWSSQNHPASGTTLPCQWNHPALPDFYYIRAILIRQQAPHLH